MTFLLSFSYLCFAQDSLQVNSNIQNFPVIIEDSVAEDSEPTTSGDKIVKKKRISEESRKSSTEDQHHVNKQNSNNDHLIFSKNIKSILLWFLFSVIILFIIVRAIQDKIYNTKIFDGTEYLSRRDYYRNVYLKSEAWQRKRFVVLKRDNWK